MWVRVHVPVHLLFSHFEFHDIHTYASIESISSVIVFMNLHHWTFVLFPIVQDCTGNTKRYVVPVVRHMNTRSTVVFRRFVCLPPSSRHLSLRMEFLTPKTCLYKRVSVMKLGVLYRFAATRWHDHDMMTWWHDDMVHTVSYCRNLSTTCWLTDRWSSVSPINGIPSYWTWRLIHSACSFKLASSSKSPILHSFVQSPQFSIHFYLTNNWNCFISFENIEHSERIQYWICHALQNYRCRTIHLKQQWARKASHCPCIKPWLRR